MRPRYSRCCCSLPASTTGISARLFASMAVWMPVQPKASSSVTTHACRGRARANGEGAAHKTQRRGERAHVEDAEAEAAELLRDVRVDEAELPGPPDEVPRVLARAIVVRGLAGRISAALASARTSSRCGRHLGDDLLLAELGGRGLHLLELLAELKVQPRRGGRRCETAARSQR